MPGTVRILLQEALKKRCVVAAQTVRSRCKVLSMQRVYYFNAYQRQRTLGLYWRRSHY